MRFFRPRPIPLPDHRFTIEIEPKRHGYRVRIHELDQIVTAVSREEAEMTAREHIAVNIGIAISRIAVHVTSGSVTTQLLRIARRPNGFCNIHLGRG